MTLWGAKEEFEVIYKMAARELICDLEESRSELHCHSYERVSLFLQIKDTEIVRVGLKYSGSLHHPIQKIF